MLILVDVRQVNGTVPGSAKEMTSDQVNPKFTCFTGTKVQILTLTRLPGVYACACRHFQERAAELRAGLPVKDDGERERKREKEEERERGRERKRKRQDCMSKMTVLALVPHSACADACGRMLTLIDVC